MCVHSRSFGRSACRVTPFPESADLPKQLHRWTVSPGDILHQAHDQAVLFRKFGDNRRDFRLTKGNERLEPALAVDQVIGGIAVRPRDSAYLDGLLQPNLVDVFDHFPEFLPIPHPRIEDRDPVDGDRLHRDAGGFARHAARSEMRARSAMAKKNASVSNRKASSIKPLSSARRMRFVRKTDSGRM